MSKLQLIVLGTVLILFTSIAPPRGGRAEAQARPLASAEKEQLVAFNIQTLKYHRRSCKWAIKCTKNCILVPVGTAIKRGGIPCKVCGGN